MEHQDEKALDVIETVRDQDEIAGNILSDLPDPMVVHLSKIFKSTKVLSVAVLASSGKMSPEAIGTKYNIPVSWVEKYRDVCMGALRQKDRERYRPTKKKVHVNPRVLRQMERERGEKRR